MLDADLEERKCNRSNVHPFQAGATHFSSTASNAGDDDAEVLLCTPSGLISDRSLGGAMERLFTTSGGRVPSGSKRVAYDPRDLLPSVW